MSLETDIAALKAGVARVKAWVQVHQWIWYVASAVGGGIVAKVFL